MEAKSRDPLLAQIAIALVFLVLLTVRIWLPANSHFDEGAYVPAAIDLLQGERVGNREHPMLGKEMIALWIGLFGNNVLAWRVPSMIYMTLALFFGSRAIWVFSRDRIASIAFVYLATTCCLTFALGRVATLDAPMLLFASLAAFALSKKRLNIAAILCGASIACKWSLAPILPLIALGVILDGPIDLRRIATELARFSLIPFAVYMATFAPGFFVSENPFTLREIIPLQFAMIEAMTTMTRSHPYQSSWWNWLFAIDRFWAYADSRENVWRGVLMVINPVTSALLLAGAINAILTRRWILPVAAILLSIALSATSSRTLYVYQSALYLVFGIGLASLLISKMWQGRWRNAVLALAALQAAVFAYLFPLLSAAPFENAEKAHDYVLFENWQFITDEQDAELREHWSPKQRAKWEACMQHPIKCQS